MNLYQACKLLPPAGALLKPGGSIIMAVSCYAGIGPIEVINEAIYRLGVIHSLPQKHRIILVSEQSPQAVAPSFAEYAPDLKSALERTDDDLIILPQAGDLIPRISTL